MPFFALTLYFEFSKQIHIFENHFSLIVLQCQGGSSLMILGQSFREMPGKSVEPQQVS